MAKLNIEALREWQRLLRNLPVHQFNIGVWGECVPGDQDVAEQACGTVVCALGLAALHRLAGLEPEWYNLNSASDLGDRLVRKMHVVYPRFLRRRLYAVRATMAAFGLSAYEAYRIIDPTSYDNHGVGLTPEDVAERIQQIIDAHEHAKYA